MQQDRPTPIPQRDIEILRRLAERKVAMANDPITQERKAAWYAHDEGAPGARPMVLAEIWGVADEVLPLSILECEHPDARGIERGMRGEIYEFEVLKDDHVVEPYFDVNWQVRVSDYGVHSEEHKTDNTGKLSAKKWLPPLANLQEDFAKLKPRTYTVDRGATMARYESMERIFGDILTMRIHGGYWWTTGLTIVAIDLIGLDNLMLYMCTDPEGLHRLMGFLRDEQLNYLNFLEKEQLLSLNNGHDYTGSGTLGYTRTLPRPERKPDEPITGRDLWVLSESQETVGVGPDMFGEFVLPYQKSIVERFGKCYYGCCEPLHLRMPLLKENLPNLARVSVSPWADEEIMARECGQEIAYSRKPHPALVSTTDFDEAAIRADIEKTLTIARGCRVEFALKDVHTLDGKPERLARWVAIAREAIGRGA